MLTNTLVVLILLVIDDFTHNMNLQKFVEINKTQKKAGEILGISQGMVSGYLTGRYKITPNTAINFQEKTCGIISAHDLLPDKFPAPSNQ